MTKDHRYKIAKNLILGGYMKTMNELFDAVPKSVVAKDIGTNLARLNKMMADTTLYNFGDVVKIAALLEIDELPVLNLLYHQYQAEKKAKRKKP